MDDLEIPEWGDLELLSDRMRGVTASEFRRRVIAKEPTAGLCFMKRLATKTVEKGTGRELRAVASASTVDLEKDTVSVEGTILKFYRTNPILLPNHDLHQLPIGVAVKLSKSGDELLGTFRYAPPEVSLLADSFYLSHLWRMEQKALGDTGAMYSIRAHPEGPDAFEFNQKRGGIDFKKQVLWEISDVTIGAQPRAQILSAKAAGVPMEPVLEWALGICKADAGLLVIDRAGAERIVKTLDPLKGLEVFEMEPPAPISPPKEPPAPDALAGFSKRLEAIEQLLKEAAAPPPAEPQAAALPEEADDPTEQEIEVMADQVLKAIDAKLIREAGICV